jgi:HipA-like C-terminal domain
MSSRESLLKILRVGYQPASVLYERLGISQPTLSRLVTQLSVSILKFGNARQTHYALRRKIGEHEQLPLYRILPDGQLEQWGILHPIMPAAYLIETFEHQGLAARMSVHKGLPWYLQDMRPQGFLGRAFTHFHASALGLSNDANEWSDDEVLLALAQTGHDSPGNLLVGVAAAATFQTGTFFSLADRNMPPVNEAQRLQHYPAFARLALAGEVVGSSAGGEQPKFNAEILRDATALHVMVKFSAPQDNASTLRWRSLLICEQLASQVLSRILPTNNSQIFSIPDAENNPQLFLEAARFDRNGARGRYGVVSLKALDDEFCGVAGDWVKTAQALLQGGKLSPALVAKIQQVYAFGVLIGNSDMHGGNLAFWVDDITTSAPKFALAPIYDMLPMALAPRASGLIPDALPTPLISPHVPLTIWREMAVLACDYWQQVAQNLAVASDVRQLAHQQKILLAQSLLG